MIILGGAGRREGGGRKEGKKKKMRQKTQDGKDKDGEAAHENAQSTAATFLTITG
jgi:hypothetical protein